MWFKYSTQRKCSLRVRYILTKEKFSLRVEGEPLACSIRYTPPFLAILPFFIFPVTRSEWHIILLLLHIFFLPFFHFSLLHHYFTSLLHLLFFFFVSASTEFYGFCFLLCQYIFILEEWSAFLSSDHLLW
jgi:hypothetical protein